ncbi:MAG TPA: glycoside hydrolase family 97 protein [Puia sp.]|nr:glycoside hydrolase family 97 protein [Puia sp.]
MIACKHDPGSPRPAVLSRILLLAALSAWVALAASPAAFAQKKISLASPDGNIRFTFRLTDSLPCYSVSYKRKNLLDPSPLSLTLSDMRSGTLSPAGFLSDDASFGRNLATPSAHFSEGEDNYSLVVGKTSSVHDRYRQVEIPLQERGGNRRLINLIVRAFNDGLAFRYEFPKQDGWSSYLLTDERTSFRMSGDPVALASFLPGFTTSHEGRYTRVPVSLMKEDTLMDMPVLFEFPGKVYMAVTEAELVDYAGMYLVKHEGIIRSCLSPLPATADTSRPSVRQSSPGQRFPGQGLVKVKATLPHRSPWRVLMISDRPGALLESNILTSLNEPSKIGNPSWLRPGKTDFHWWNGDIVPDTTFPPGVNFETDKYYIDFCAASGLDYHTVIGYGGVAWYQNDGDSYSPGPHSDVTIPLPSLDMQRICDYAKTKGVGIRVWVNWEALYRNLDKAFDQFEKWGIRGMMVDFMDRDDQEMVNIQIEILQKAAAHHLHIQFHGAYKPTGLSRTYPNELTREGTLNYENDKWDNPITPDDDMNILFTRLLAGATDYHLGGFRAVPPSGYRPQYTRPLVLGSRCHMLAMYVILENYLAMVCDYPAAYEGQPGFDFLKEVPTVWDETRVVGADPGNWITIARRKGEEWWVGSITNGKAREIGLPLGFLSAGTAYTATLYSDAPDAAGQPDHLVRESRAIHSTDILTVSLAPGGGQVMRITPRPARP